MADNFNMKQFLAENKLGAYSRLKEEKMNEAKDIASFLNANMDEFTQKIGDPGSEFEVIGDPLVATAGTDDTSGIDVSFNKEHMLKLFPEGDPYNKVESVEIAGRTIYYNDYLRDKITKEDNAGAEEEKMMDFLAEKNQ